MSLFRLLKQFFAHFILLDRFLFLFVILYHLFGFLTCESIVTALFFFIFFAFVDARVCLKLFILLFYDWINKMRHTASYRNVKRTHQEITIVFFFSKPFKHYTGIMSVLIAGVLPFEICDWITACTSKPFALIFLFILALSLSISACLTLALSLYFFCVTWIYEMWICVYQIRSCEMRVLSMLFSLKKKFSVWICLHDLPLANNKLMFDCLQQQKNNPFM